ncbi:MAG: DUF5063 domain-containing protein [Verrucomicrobiota bacterium]
MSATTSDAVGQFAAEAVHFRAWARDETDSGELAVRKALIRIGALYFAALQLPPEWSDELADASDTERISGDEKRAVYQRAAARLPFTDYARVFDPFVLPPEEPIIGSISDDVADIYDDVVSGLVEYEAGHTARALWQWAFCFRMHWGRHATDAIYALHIWLSENAWDQFHPNEP